MAVLEKLPERKKECALKRAAMQTQKKDST